MREERSAESLGALVRGLLEDISTLFRSEIALAKIEIRQTVAGLGGVAALFAGALLFVLIGLAFLFVTLVLLLALVMPAWAATLLVAIVLFALAAGAALLGRSRLRKTEFAPMEAIRGMKTDVEMIRSEIERVRGRDDDEQ
ncbi:MAG TPA: phage holin family protein [Thermoanaerobaculia bacterium]